MTTPNLVEKRSDRTFFVFNAIVSCAAIAFIAFILFRRGESGEVDLGFLPAVNAGFNALSAACLVSGYLAIRRGRVRVHRMFMVSAWITTPSTASTIGSS